jgi:EAL domain-containing protein (putative c-di-GMP-specific phosphodiesterase class I)
MNRLKIDRSFVQAICDQPRDRAIVTRLVQLAHDLGMQVTAEGVETAEQMELLQSIDCDDVQGYLFSKPVAAGVFPTLLGEIRSAA